MSIKHLYWKLSTRERLSVFLRARGRNNLGEIEAVVSSSPSITVSAPDFFPHVQALQAMLFTHWLCQMDRLLMLLILTNIWKKNPEAFALASELVKTYLNAEIACKAVCDEYGLDYDQFLSGILSEFPAFARVRSSDFLALIAEFDSDNLSSFSEPVTPEAQISEYRIVIQALIQKMGTHLAKRPS